MEVTVAPVCINCASFVFWKHVMYFDGFGDVALNLLRGRCFVGYGIVTMSFWG